MHRQAPANPRDSRHIFRSEPTTCDSDSAMRESFQQPIFEDDIRDFATSPKFPPLSDAHGECNVVHELLFRQVLQHILYQGRDFGGPICWASAVPQSRHPSFRQEASRHVHWLRLRLSTTGFHARLREYCALSHFFPRSVGFGPTASIASGALTIAPSILCHAQAIPFISSYSASPARQMRTKTPLRFHSRKYLCTELALPNSFGSAFHWQPVRRTYTIAAKTFWGSIGFRPPPTFLLYFFSFSRFLSGIRGATLFHNASDTVHDLIAFMSAILTWRLPRVNIIYG